MNAGRFAAPSLTPLYQPNQPIRLFQDSSEGNSIARTYHLQQVQSTCCLQFIDSEEVTLSKLLMYDYAT
jgi:hypothetical protein